MLLAIDVGNTNTVFSIFENDVMIDHWRIRTEASRTMDEYASFLLQVSKLANVELDSVNKVIISSVVPETHFALSRFCEKYLQINPVFVTKDMVNIVIDLKRPEDVGADRLVNAIGVLSEYSSPAIVIDFGTATTFDVINSDESYGGGVIAPGINLSLNALHSAASKLPKVSIEPTEKVIGKTTVEAMKSGLFWGYSSMVEGLLKRLCDEIDGQPLIIATGGLANIFAQNIELINVVDEQLTLKGLQVLSEKL
ncbi:MAG: pantothenate kinase [Micavibrio sp. TMED27]|nr:pantothenate kinase [Micavibrio sp.]OUT90110.1 MAG: pantothenate kinase [Micavibrio sp. TMED27]